LDVVATRNNGEHVVSGEYALQFQKWDLQIWMTLSGVSTNLVGRLVGPLTIEAPENSPASCTFDIYGWPNWLSEYDYDLQVKVRQINNLGVYTTYTVFTGYTYPVTRVPFSNVFNVQGFDIATKLNKTEWESDAITDHVTFIEEICAADSVTVNWLVTKTSSTPHLGMYEKKGGYDFIRELLYTWGAYAEATPAGELNVRDSSTKTTPDWALTDTNMPNWEQLTVEKLDERQIINVQKVRNDEQDVLYELTDPGSVSYYGEQEGDEISSKYIQDNYDAYNVARETIHQSHCLYNVELPLIFLAELERGDTVSFYSASRGITLKSPVRGYVHTLEPLTATALTKASFSVRKKVNE